MHQRFSLAVRWFSLILIFAAAVSAAVGEAHEAIIIGLIVIGSCLLGFSQEYGGSDLCPSLHDELRPGELLFAFVTFGFLLFVVKAGAPTFRTAWFIESLLTELGIVLVIRTGKTFWTSRPSTPLLTLTAAVVLFAVAISYLPHASWFGFVPSPWWVTAGLFGITLAHLAASEVTKHLFRPWDPKQPKRRRRLPRHLS